ncbi:MAG TPA: hypothetical protein PKD90_10360 [Phnomibacter sp.]|nr:hypothetical protein [Phnomibacter sp.]
MILLLKKLDVTGQLLVLAATIISAMAGGFDVLMGGYFVMGSWQLLSLWLNYRYAAHYPLSVQRGMYAKVVLGCLALGLLCLIWQPLVWCYLLLLLLAGPALAVWNLSFSYTEWQSWQARALIQMR